MGTEVTCHLMPLMATKIHKIIPKMSVTVQRLTPITLTTVLTGSIRHIDSNMDQRVF